MERPRSTLRTAVVWDALREILRDPSGSAGATGDADEDASAGSGRNSVGGQRIVDVGGGTGGFAVRLAELGHQVTVVDPSPDALASLQRRADEAEVAVAATLGDADRLSEVVPAKSADLVLCHGVLELVDSPAAALHQIATVLVPSGRLSIVAAQTSGAVLARAIAGHLDDARAVLDDPEGRMGPAESSSRRFTDSELRALLDAAGFTTQRVRGVRVFSDHISSTVIDSDPAAADQLRALEAAVADRPEYQAMATQLHVVAALH